VFPELVEASAAVEAAQSQHPFRTGLGPAHAGLFAAGTNDGFATGFHHARTNETTRFPKGAILHPRHIALKIAQGVGHRLCLWLAERSLKV